MKTLFFAFFLVTALSSRALDVPEVNQRTIEKFQVAFKEATDVKWYAEENYDQVYCLIKGIKTQIKYDKEGKFVSCFRMYGANELPVIVQYKLNQEYANKKVTSVAELTTDGSIEYHLVLEDDKFWYNVKSDSFGNLTTDKKFKKV
ncbi:MAG TPA: hypothetical protein VFV46_06830 [Lacibacter sp.]|nr:hypothetical protein [Lacibacter sp.]